MAHLFLLQLRITNSKGCEIDEIVFLQFTREAMDISSTSKRPPHPYRICEGEGGGSHRARNGYRADTEKRVHRGHETALGRREGSKSADLSLQFVSLAFLSHVRLGRWSRSTKILLPSPPPVAPSLLDVDSLERRLAPLIQLDDPFLVPVTVQEAKPKTACRKRRQVSQLAATAHSRTMEFCLKTDGARFPRERHHNWALHMSQYTTSSCRACSVQASAYYGRNAVWSKRRLSFT